MVRNLSIVMRVFFFCPNVIGVSNTVSSLNFLEYFYTQPLRLDIKVRFFTLSVVKSECAHIVVHPSLSKIKKRCVFATVQRVFSQRSERVKGIDIHPTEPWYVLDFPPFYTSIWRTYFLYGIPLYVSPWPPGLKSSLSSFRVVASLYNGHVYIWNYVEQVNWLLSEKLKTVSSFFVWIRFDKLPYLYIVT